MGRCIENCLGYRGSGLGYVGLVVVGCGEGGSSCWVV